MHANNEFMCVISVLRSTTVSEQATGRELVGVFISERCTMTVSVQDYICTPITSNEQQHPPKEYMKLIADED